MPYNPKRIVILGATGTLGNPILHHLLEVESDAEFLATARFNVSLVHLVSKFKCENNRLKLQQYSLSKGARSLASSIGKHWETFDHLIYAISATPHKKHELLSSDSEADLVLKNYRDILCAGLKHTIRELQEMINKLGSIIVICDGIYKQTIPQTNERSDLHSYLAACQDREAAITILRKDCRIPIIALYPSAVDTRRHHQAYQDDERPYSSLQEVAARTSLALKLNIHTDDAWHPAEKSLA